MNKKIIGFLAAAAAAFLLSGPAAGQEEAASRYYHYRTTEMSTGVYEEYEVRPRGGQVRLESRVGPRIGVTRVHEKDSRAWNRYFLNDAHQDLPFYEYRRCVDCHSHNTRNRHTVRYGITCRQCHGGEPIASVKNYSSRLNPIRQHTHVCAKCHAGATAAFADYRIHEPSPADVATASTFPVLFYAFWVMIAIAVLTFALFLPHTFVWMIRELFAKKK